MLGLVGVFDFFSARRMRHRERAARQAELDGDLGLAAKLYVDAELADEAARVLLLRADAETTADRRIALAAAAARTAKDPGLARQALTRKAKLTLAVLEAAAGPELRDEAARVAGELERTGEHLDAARAYALAGDHEGEVRALTEAGAIDQLERRLNAEAAAEAGERERARVWERVGDLRSSGERREAIALARSWLTAHDDEEIRAALADLEVRTVAGRAVTLEIDGARRAWVLGDSLTIGRREADIRVESALLSRLHLRVSRADGVILVEDLETSNGTHLAGARLGGPLPVGEGLDLRLGGQVPCVITPHETPAAVQIDVSGERYLAPLGDLVLGGWRIACTTADGADYVTLSTAGGAEPPYAGAIQLSRTIELAVGDALSRERHGAVALRVIARAGEAA